MERLSLVLVGDLMLGRCVNEALTKNGMRHVWGNFQPLLSGGLGKNQIVAGNLECAITTHYEKEEKEFNFKLSPTNARVLKMASFDYVSLANNHSLDFRIPGLMETRQVLEDTEIAYSGVGTKSEAMKPAFVKRAEYIVAFFSFSDQYPAWAANEKTPGVNFIDPEDYSLKQFKEEVKIAKEEKAVDFIVVSIHWGPNWSWHPSDTVCSLAHDFASNGADIIFGHSSHHIQGIEIFKGVPIIYGAGAFVDDYSLDQSYRNDLGFLYCIKIDKSKIQKIDLVPAKIEHIRQDEANQPAVISKVVKAENEDYDWLLNKMTTLCRFYGTTIEDKGDERGLTIDMENHAIKLKKRNTPKQFGVL